MADDNHCNQQSTNDVPDPSTSSLLELTIAHSKKLLDSDMLTTLDLQTDILDSQFDTHKWEYDSYLA